jgi:general secretion pathway protein K
MMVIAAVSVLSILVTEFTYVAQINQKIAFDGLDQVQAHYLAKSGLKLSLLRLKAYANVKNFIKGMGGGADKMVPKGLVDKVWSFPFFYPIPTDIPGMTPSDKEKVQKFQKASNLAGKFSSIIESESGRYNLNLLLASFVPAAPTATPSPTGGATPSPNTPGTSNPNPNPSPSPTESQKPFDPQAARDSLATYLQTLFNNKAESDPDFAADYRDTHLIEDLVDSIAGWADHSYERKNQGLDFVPKRAPFYSVSELHMIPGMDDQLYDLFAPNLTVSRTPGVNVNTMNESTLRALLPGPLVKEEVEEFFKFRDSQEEDNAFKSEDDFFKYLKEKFSGFARNPSALDDFRAKLPERNVRLVVDESEFKITVTSQVNQSSQRIEAWVTLDAEGSADKLPASNSAAGAAPPPAVPVAPVATTGGDKPVADPGLRIHFMRFL